MVGGKQMYVCHENVYCSKFSLLWQSNFMELIGLPECSCQFGHSQWFQVNVTFKTLVYLFLFCTMLLNKNINHAGLMQICVEHFLRKTDDRSFQPIDTTVY